MRGFATRCLPFLLNYKENAKDYAMALTRIQECVRFYCFSIVLFVKWAFHPSCAIELTNIVFTFVDVVLFVSNPTRNVRNQHIFS